MSIPATLLLGGKLDKLPYPLFPRFKNPYTKGFKINIPATIGDTTITLQLPQVELEVLEIVFTANVYKDGDYWSMKANNTYLLQEIYTKRVGQVKALKSVRKLEVGDTLTFVYHNNSASGVTVWLDIDFTAKDEVV